MKGELSGLIPTVNTHERVNNKSVKIPGFSWDSNPRPSSSEETDTLTIKLLALLGRGAKTSSLA